MKTSKLGLLQVSLACAFACQTGAGAPLAQERPAVLGGRVVDAASSEPLSKTEVMLFALSGGEIRATRTDTDGKYGFSDVAPGTYKLTAVKNGWAHQEYSSASRSRRAAQLVVEPGLQLANLDFRLDRAAVVFGRVTDRDASPLAGARVILYRSRYRGLERQLVPGQGAQTNDLGEYRLHNIQPGDYYVAVDYQDHLLSDSGVKYEGTEEGNYTRTYYLGVLDPADALPVRLRPDEVRGVDFELRRVKSVRVTGVIRVAGGGALEPNITVEMTPRWDILGRLRRRLAPVERETGRFEYASVPPGSYVLVAAKKVNDTKLYAYEPIEVQDRSIENLDLRLEPGATVSGRVRLQGKGADRYSFRDGQLRVRLAGGRPSPANTGGGVEEGGAFVITDVAPMIYSMGIGNLPPDAYLKTIKLSGHELPDRKLSLEGSERVEDLEVIVRLDGGRVDGIVVDEERIPFGGATVVAIPEKAMRDRLPLFKTAQTDNLGRYSIRGLMPGKYRLLALEEIEPGAYWQPEFLEKFGGQGELADVEDGSRQTLVLEVTAIDSLALP